MPSRRSTDSFIHRTRTVLQREYFIIGKQRTSSLAAWSIITFCLGIFIAVAFFSSRTGTLESGQAALFLREQLAKSADQTIGLAEQTKNIILSNAQKAGITLPHYALTQYETFIDRARKERETGHYSESIRFAEEAGVSINYSSARKSLGELDAIFQKRIIPMERVGVFLQYISQAEDAFAQGEYGKAKRLAQHAQKLLTPAAVAAKFNEARKTKSLIISVAQKNAFPLPSSAVSTFDSLLFEADAAFNNLDLERAELLAQEAIDAIHYDAAEKAIKNAKAKALARRTTPLSDHTLSVFTILITQASSAYDQGNYAEAKRFALKAQKSVDQAGAQSLLNNAQRTRINVFAAAQRSNNALPTKRALDAFDQRLSQAMTAFSAGNYAEAADFAQQALDDINFSEAERLIKSLNATRANKEKLGEILSPEQFNRFSSFFSKAKDAYNQGDYRMATMYATDAKRSIDYRETQSLLTNVQKSKIQLEVNARKSGDVISAELMNAYEKLIAQTEDAYERKDYLASRSTALQAWGKVVGAPDIPLATLHPSGGAFTNGVLVSISTNTPDSSLRYTLDGTIPTERSLYYTGPIAIFETTTLKARVFVGKNGSMVQEAVFTLPTGVNLPELPPSDVPSPTPTPTPTPTPQPGGDSPISVSPYKEGGFGFRGSVQVSLSAEDSSLALYYTTDGRTPHPSSGTRYTGPFALSRDSVVKAAAFRGSSPVGGIASAVFINEMTPGSVAYKQLAAGQPWFGEHRRDVLVANLTGSPALTKAGVERQIFTDPERSFNAFYQTISFGQVWFTGTVFGPYDVSIDGQAFLIKKQNEGLKYHQACNALFAEARKAIEDRANADGFNPALFANSLTAKTIMFINYPGCEGVAGVPTELYFSGRVPIGPRYDVGSINIIHQVHDKAGNLHSHGVDCGAKAIDKASACTFVDVADPFDVAGHVWEGYNLFPAEKIDVGWVPSDRVQDITQNGTYTLYTSSRKEFPPSGPILFRLAKPDTNIGSTKSSYYIDYRQPAAADVTLAKYPGFTSGINIHVTGINDRTNSRGNGLLDLTPGSNPAGCNTTLRGYGACPFLDAALSDGKTFADDVNGIKITQLSHDSEKATFRVEFIPPAQGGGGTTAENIPTLPPLSNDLPPINTSLASTYPDLVTQTLLVNKLVAQPNETLTATARVYNRNVLLTVGKKFPVRLYPNINPSAAAPAYGSASAVPEQQITLLDPDTQSETMQNVVFSFKASAEPGWKNMYVVVDNGAPGVVQESDDTLESNRRAWRYYVLDPKFAANKRVVTNRAVNVRGGPNSAISGTQPQGAAGTVVTASVDFASGTAWVFVNFDNGQDGFVFVDFLTAP